jgi:MFS family permease
MLPVRFSNTATAANPALTSDLLRSPADTGRAFAFLVLGGNIFGLLAPIVTGYIVQATGSFALAFVLAGVLALLGAVLSLVLTRHTLGEAPIAGQIGQWWRCGDDADCKQKRLRTSDAGWLPPIDSPAGDHP